MVSFSAHLQTLAHEDFLDGHLVAREGTGLVGADDRHRAQGFGGGEATDEGAPAGHAAHADGEHDGDHDGKALGHGGHRERDGHVEHLGHVAAGEDAEQPDHDDGDQHQDAYLAPKLPHAALQGRGPFGGGHVRGDLAHLGGHAGRHHHATATAAGDHRVHVGHIDAIAQRQVPFGKRGGVLGIRDGFSREARLVDGQLGRREQADVGGQAIARLQEEHVPGNDFRGQELMDDPGSPDPRPRTREPAQGLDGVGGLGLLDEADGRVEEEHGHDHPDVERISDEDGDQRRDAEDSDQRALELRAETLPSRGALLKLELVGAENLEPLSRLLDAQAVGGGRQGLHDLRRRQNMPWPHDHA
ncbi:hypothetical protein D3C87_1000230 [compost metagenome]